MADSVDNIVDSLSNLQIDVKQEAVDDVQQVIAEKPLNKFQGTQPNVKWRAFTVDELEKHERFIPMTEAMPAQRSEEWLEQRRNHVTGSQLSKALGFFSSKAIIKRLGLDARTYYRKGELGDHYFNINATAESGDQRETVFSEAQRVFMDWGTNHETNAILTFLQAFPEYAVKETGFWSSNEKSELKERVDQLVRESFEAEEDYLTISKYLPRIGASPDGLLLDKSSQQLLGVLEIKCPTPFVPVASKQQQQDTAMTYQYIKRKPHEKIPVYYLPQIMLQMFVTDVQQSLFCSWCVTSGMKVFRVKYNKDYLSQMFYWIAKFNENYLLSLSNNNDSSTPSFDEEEFMKTFENDDKYLQFVTENLRIVNEDVELVKYVDKSEVSESDKRMFLERN